MQSKERETLQALEIDLGSPYQLGPSESQTTEVKEKEEGKGKQEDIENTASHETTWEQRYENIWVEIEKKETKSQYKSVAAELKERFGEMEQKVQCETAKDKEAAEEEEEANTYKRKDTVVPEGPSKEDSGEDKDELIMQPTAQARRVRLLPIPEQRESGQEESCSEDHPDNDFAKHKAIQQDSSKTSNEKDQETESSSYQRPGYGTDVFANLSENKENLKPACLSGLKTPLDMNQESSQQTGISLLHFVEEARVLPSVPDTMSCSSDELVEEGLQRSINEVGKWTRRRSQHCSSNLQRHFCLFHFLSLILYL